MLTHSIPPHLPPRGSPRPGIQPSPAIAPLNWTGLQEKTPTISPEEQEAAEKAERAAKKAAEKAEKAAELARAKAAADAKKAAAAAKQAAEAAAAEEGRLERERRTRERADKRQQDLVCPKPWIKSSLKVTKRPLLCMREEH